MTARIAAGLRALGVGPGDRVVAYMPNMPETIAAFLATRVDRRGVVELLARLRRTLGGRPLRPDRAEGAAGGGRLPLQRHATSTAARWWRGSRGEIGARVVWLGYLDGSGWEDGFLGEPGELRVRAAALRPPAVGALQLRHHRPPEGDRAWPGRHPARAPQEDEPAPRRPGRRPGVLVHHHRVDDVELPRGRAAHRRRDRALRRQPRAPRPGRAVGPRRAHGHDVLRHVGRVPGVVHEGRGGARRWARPRGAAQRRLHRLAAVARGLSVGLRPARRGHVAVLHLRRHRRVHGVRGRMPAAAGAHGRAPGARARRQGGGLRRGRAAAGGRDGRAGDHRADALDAGLLLERPRRRAPARELLRHVPGHLAPRRLDRDHRPRHGGDLRPLGLNDQPRRGAHGHERDLPRGARHRRDRGRAGGGRPARGRGELDAAVRRAARGRVARRRAGARDRAARARGVLAAPRAERGVRHRRGAAHAVGQGARGAGQAHPDGHPAGAGGEPRLAAEPRRAGLVQRPRGKGGRAAKVPDVGAEVRISEYTDPGCPWAWSAEPFRRRLAWLYGDSIEWRERMVVLSEAPEDYEEKGFTPAEAGPGVRERSRRTTACRSTPRSGRGWPPRCPLAVRSWRPS